MRIFDFIAILISSILATILFLATGIKFSTALFGGIGLLVFGLAALNYLNHGKIFPLRKNKCQ